MCSAHVGVVLFPSGTPFIVRAFRDASHVVGYDGAHPFAFLEIFRCHENVFGVVNVFEELAGFVLVVWDDAVSEFGEPVSNILLEFFIGVREFVVDTFFHVDG